MSELSDLTGGPNRTAIPGFTMNHLSAVELADAESEANAQFIENIERGVARLPVERRNAVLAQAMSTLADSPFAFGTWGFRRWAMSTRGSQYLVFLSLRAADAKTQQVEAAKLFSANMVAARNAIWDILGIGTEKPKKKPVESNTAASTSPQSSSDSPPPPPAASDIPTPKPPE
jgi:hypothetical protein